jgi:hypothetical protein
VRAGGFRIAFAQRTFTQAEQGGGVAAIDAQHQAVLNASCDEVSAPERGAGVVQDVGDRCFIGLNAGRRLRDGRRFTCSPGGAGTD